MLSGPIVVTMTTVSHCPRKSPVASGCVRRCSRHGRTLKPGRKVKDPRLHAMPRKLKTEADKKVYAKRKQTVEPVFGIIKHVMGYR